MEPELLTNPDFDDFDWSNLGLDPVYISHFSKGIKKDISILPNEIDPEMMNSLPNFIKEPLESSYKTYKFHEFEKFEPTFEYMPLQENTISPYLESYEASSSKKNIGSALINRLAKLIVKENIGLVPLPSPPSTVRINYLTPGLPSQGSDGLLGGSPNSLNSLDLFSRPDSIKPEDLPEMAMPIVDFIEEVKPHIVIGCDRGGRLFSVAVHAAWNETRDGAAFPTLDGKIHFARISTTEDRDLLQEKVDGIVASSKKQGEQRGNELADDEQLRVMFIDDWVIGGNTAMLARGLMDKHGAKTYFTVMCGDGADATGQQDRQTRVSWHDRPEHIGVNYLGSFHEEADGSITQTQEVVVVRDEKATTSRQKIYAAAKNLPKSTAEEKAA